LSNLDIEFDPSGKREFLFIIWGVIFVVSSCYLDYLYFLDINTWFQRSGALLVILGAICESKHIEKVIAPDKGIIGTPLSTKQKFVVHSGFIMAIIGTLIWAYGDLPNT
jgi:hypothetical protein